MTNRKSGTLVTLAVGVWQVTGHSISNVLLGLGSRFLVLQDIIML